MNKSLVDLTSEELEALDELIAHIGHDKLSKFTPGKPTSEWAGTSVDDSVEMVRGFHKLIGAEISNRPMLLGTNEEKCKSACQLLENTLFQLRELASDEDTLLSRLCLSIEETVEWLQSHINHDLIAAADAIGDRVYVLFGDAVSSGMPLQGIFEEIHRSNMSKAESKQGQLGKADKSDGYREPQLELILALAQTNLDGIETG